MNPAENALSSILPYQKQTWDGKWFLTFDMDFAIDEVIEDTLDILSKFNIRSTFFLTNATSHIDRIRSDGAIDVGIHPNFNPLLDGLAGGDGSAKKVLDDLMSIFPEAKTVRSHSLVQSGRLHQLFSDAGLTHDSNTFLPSGRANASSPWFDWLGLIRVPYHWQDSFSFLIEATAHPAPPPTEIINKDEGFCVFNFHPIHVFLNTDSLERYEAARPFHHDLNRLSDFRFEGYGTRDRLIDLLRATE